MPNMERRVGEHGLPRRQSSQAVHCDKLYFQGFAVPQRTLCRRTHKGMPNVECRVGERGLPHGQSSQAVSQACSSVTYCVAVPQSTLCRRTQVMPNVECRVGGCAYLVDSLPKPCP